jgi:serine phosphatase RsbU (regulator of sigma subunit)
LLLFRGENVFCHWLLKSLLSIAENIKVELINTTPNDTFELEIKLEEARSKIHDLATMGTLITSIPEIETILSVVMEMAIRTVDGEVGLIQLFDDGMLKSKITWGLDDTLIRQIIYKDDQDVSQYSFNKQETIIFNGVDMRIENGPMIANLISVPIKSRARCHGTVIIVNKNSGDEFSEDNRKNLEMLVNFAAVAIDNSLLREESLQKQKIEQELAIARQVQEAILPEEELNIDGIEIGTLYCPAKAVGGDFYDIIQVGESQFWTIIGDVSNKGVPAAMVMSATIAIIKSTIYDMADISPAKLMMNLNKILCDSVIKSQGMFVTLFIARYDLRQKTLSYCNAGHVPPLYWDVKNNKTDELKSGGTFVGQFDDIEYNQGQLDINCGDRIFAFTDGLTEAEDIHQGFFGVERVKQIFLAEKELPAFKFCERLKEWADRFREGTQTDTVDDFTLLQIKIV